MTVGTIAFMLLRDRAPARARAPATTRPRAHAPGGVDVNAYRASYRERLERARQVVARRRAARAATGAAVSRDAAAGRAHIVHQLMEPQCILGPAALCEAIAEAVLDCADGDGQACLAVAQYLADTPPRPLVALAFLHYACEAGEADGCRRMQEVKEPTDAPCADDPFRCGWGAFQSRDLGRLDEACTHGVADACASLNTTHDDADDLVRSRSYLEAGCQLGNPMACEELGRRLDPACRPERRLSDDGQPMYFPCFPPDPAQAAEARAIACEAGFEEACASR